MPTLKEVMDGLQAKLDPAKTQGLSAVYQFDLSGAESGVYCLNFKDGQGSISEGPSDAANITVSMDSEDFKSLVAGQLNPTMAFMSGKLKVKGDMGLAMRLQSIIG